MAEPMTVISWRVGDAATNYDADRLLLDLALSVHDAVRDQYADRIVADSRCSWAGYCNDAADHRDGGRAEFLRYLTDLNATEAEIVMATAQWDECSRPFAVVHSQPVLPVRLN